MTKESKYNIISAIIGVILTIIIISLCNLLGITITI
jgi:uncharacterized membrane protein